MAVKRSFSLNNKSHCVCLKCGAQILPDDLKDNTVYKCVRCGQKITVDRYDSRAVLTVIEKPGKSSGRAGALDRGNQRERGRRQCLN